MTDQRADQLATEPQAAGGFVLTYTDSMRRCTAQYCPAGLTYQCIWETGHDGPHAYNWESPCRFSIDGNRACSLDADHGGDHLT